MTANIPTIQDIYERMRDNYRTLSGGDPVGGDQSAVGMLMQSVSGAMFENYQYTKNQFQNGFVHSADGDALALHGIDFGVRRISAHKLGIILASNVIVNEGEIFKLVYQTAIGKEYDFIVNGQADDGRQIIEFVSDMPTTIAIGDIFISKNRQLSNNPTYVIDLIPATGDESDDDYRLRILQKIQNVPLSGSEHDYLRWVKENGFVKDAWVFGNTPSAGRVTIYFITDNGLPNNNELFIARNYINARRPVTALVIVAAPTFVPIDITIRSSATAEQQTLVEESLQNLFDREGAPGVNISNNQITAAIAFVEGVKEFTIQLSNVNTVGTDEILTLRNVTWTQPS